MLYCHNGPVVTAPPPGIVSGLAAAAADRDCKHVLLVDAEAGSHSSVEQAVRGADLQITCVADGAQALRVLERRRVDLLITALAMPVLDGVDLLRHITNRGLMLAVVVLTGHDAPPPGRRSPLRFVRETSRADVLADAVHTLLRAGRPDRPLGPAEFAQILAVERRSCTLRAIHHDAHAELVFASGVLVDATLGPLRGDAAARVMLAWPHARLRVDPRTSPREVTVHNALTNLLPEADVVPLVIPTLPAPPAPILPPAEVAAAPPDSPVLRSPSDTATAVAPDSPMTPPEIDAVATPVTTPAWERPDTQAQIDALLTGAMRIDGALGVGLAVWELDHSLGTRTAPGAPADGRIEVALSGNCRVMRALATMHARLGGKGELHDIVFAVDDQLEVLTPLRGHEGLFLYLVLDAKRSNMVLARVKVARLLAALDLGPA